MVAWFAYEGKEDPSKRGPVIRESEEFKEVAQPKFPFPVPRVALDEQIKSVASEYCGGIFDDAETMLHRRPSRFYRFLNTLRAKAIADPIRDRAQQKNSEQGSKHSAFANSTIGK